MKAAPPGGPILNTATTGWLGRAGRWIVAILVGVLIVCLSLRKIWTVDYWWQWKLGELIASTGIPDTDVFCYTDAGQPRLELRWGYCWALHWLTTTFGHGAAVVAQCAIAVATVGIAGLAGLRRGAGPLWVAMVTCLAVLAASQRFMVRPEMLTYLFFIAFVAIVDRARRHTSAWVWSLPAIEVMWVNTHGPFILGPAVIGVWLVEELFKRVAGRRSSAPEAGARGQVRLAAGVLALTLAAACINPYLHRAFLLPVLQMQWLHGTSYKEFISELHSPFAFGHQYTALWYYKLLIVIVAASMALNVKRQQLFWVVLIASQFYLSATAIRNIPLFCLTAIPFAAVNLSESWVWRGRWARTATPAARVAGGLLVVVFCAYHARESVTNRAAIKQGDTNEFGIGIAPHRFPMQAAKFLKDLGARGRMFNTVADGSYFIAEGFPVFIGPHVQENVQPMLAMYQEILGSPAAFSQHAERLGFRVVVLESDMLEPIKAMLTRPDWRLVYADEVAVIFFHRAESPQTPAIDPRQDEGRWAAAMRATIPPPVSFERSGLFTKLTNPAPYRRLANLCFTLGVYSAARDWYEDAQRACPPAFVDFDPLGYAAAAEGDFATAARHYEDALLRDPANVGLRRRTALALINSGAPDQALPHIEAALERMPDDAETLAVRGAAELALNQPQRAIDSLSAAIRLRPGEASYRVQLARAYAAQSRFDEALAELEAGHRLNSSDLNIIKNLAALLLSLRRVDEARQWVERAEALAPNDMQVRELRRSCESASQR